MWTVPSPPAASCRSSTQVLPDVSRRVRRVGTERKPRSQNQSLVIIAALGQPWRFEKLPQRFAQLLAIRRRAKPGKERLEKRPMPHPRRQVERHALQAVAEHRQLVDAPITPRKQQMLGKI